MMKLVEFRDEAGKPMLKPMDKKHNSFFRHVTGGCLAVTPEAWNDTYKDALYMHGWPVHCEILADPEDYDIANTHKNRLKIALLNTTIATADGTYTVETISLKQAKRHIDYAMGDIDSAIGHQSTADIMTTLLDTKVEMKRQMFQQKPGQMALVFKLKGRPEEGKILTAEEIEDVGYEWKLMTRTK